MAKRRSRQKPWEPYSVIPKSATGRYILCRDGVEICRGSDHACAAYIHRNHSYSFDHALKHEGYSMKPDPVGDGRLLGGA